MQRYKIIFSYDGSNFNGYQKQDNLRTVQGELEKALQYINNDIYTKLVSSGRTDKGVHAFRQVGHADILVDINEYKLKCALNSLTDDDIHVINTEKVDNSFHARYMVKNKIYLYKINLGEYNPIDRKYIYQYNKKLDVKKMIEGSKYLLGKHDFKSFTTSDCDKNTNREIYDINFKIVDNILNIEFNGNGFLKYMVRIIVGALIKVGEGKIDPIQINEILNSKNRSKAFFTANSCGLYLKDVKY